MGTDIGGEKPVRGLSWKPPAGIVGGGITATFLGLIARGATPDQYAYAVAAWATATLVTVVGWCVKNFLGKDRQFVGIDEFARMEADRDWWRADSLRKTDVLVRQSQTNEGLATKVIETASEHGSHVGGGT